MRGKVSLLFVVALFLVSCGGGSAVGFIGVEKQKEYANELKEKGLYPQAVAEFKKLQEQGIAVILYSYKNFLDVNTSPVFGSYPIWIAAYLNTPETSLPKIPNGWNDWQIWQFTEKGQIDGYTGELDLNMMKKDFFNKF